MWKDLFGWGTQGVACVRQGVACVRQGGTKRRPINNLLVSWQEHSRINVGPWGYNHRAQPLAAVLVIVIEWLAGVPAVVDYEHRFAEHEGNPEETGKLFIGHP